MEDPGATAAIAERTILESSITYPTNELYHRALAAVGVDVTYQVHPGGQDIPDFDDELTALLAWGRFKPVVTDPPSWVHDTVAPGGQLSDIGYRCAKPPSQAVQFGQTGSMLSVSAAGSDVTITTAGGCAIRTAATATIDLTSQTCSSHGVVGHGPASSKCHR